MKKTKRVLALLLAVMVVVGLLAVNVSAMVDTAWGTCPKCGNRASYVLSTKTSSQTVSSCTTYPVQHQHLLTINTYKWDCPVDGAFDEVRRSTTCLAPK